MHPSDGWSTFEALVRFEVVLQVVNLLAFIAASIRL